MFWHFSFILRIYFSCPLLFIYFVYLIWCGLVVSSVFLTIEADTTHPDDMPDQTSFRVHAQLLFVNLICHCLIDLRGLNIWNFLHSSEYIPVNRSENKMNDWKLLNYLTGVIIWTGISQSLYSYLILIYDNQLQMKIGNYHWKQHTEVWNLCKDNDLHAINWLNIFTQTCR